MTHHRSVKADYVVIDKSNKLFNKYPVGSFTSTVNFNDDSMCCFVLHSSLFAQPDQSIVCQSVVKITWVVVVARQVEIQLVY